MSISSLKNRKFKMDFPSEKRFKKLFGGISVSDPLKASEVFHTRKNAMSAPKLWKILKEKLCRKGSRSFKSRVTSNLKVILSRCKADTARTHGSTDQSMNSEIKFTLLKFWCYIVNFVTSFKLVSWAEVRTRFMSTCFVSKPKNSFCQHSFSEQREKLISWMNS